MLLVVPIAWLQLTHQKVRFLVTLAGVAFVVILVFMQLGFQDALYDSAVKVHRSLDGDLFLLSPQYASLTSQQSFPRQRLYQTLGFDQVKSVKSLYIQFGKLKNIQTGKKRALFVFGVDPAESIFTLPEINAQLDQLKIPDMTLFDRLSRPEFGPIATAFEQTGPVEVEISSFNELTQAKRLTVCGLFTLGPSYGVDGSLVVNYLTFNHMFLDRTPEEIDIGAITLASGADPQATLIQLRKNLPQDVRVLDPQEFISLEKSYWAKRTPIGFIFTMMVIMVFVVGIVIVYQILHSNIANYLIEFATLKAVGYSDRFLWIAVLQQAVILAVIGFISGFVATLVLYDVARTATRLPIVMTVSKGIGVLIAILVMCTLSGTVAASKLRSADPADIFN